MQLERVSKTSDHYGRYYTEEGVATLLVEAMGTHSPELVIDLGVGDGALVGAASQKWARARFVTLDIDAHAGGQSSHAKAMSSTHHIGDALGDNLCQHIGVSYGSVDSALCNPPYVRPRWRKHFAEILEDAGLSSVMPKIGCVPADILFIAQNLRFLRKGGKLGLILPDGIIAGEKFAKLRQVLATAHRLERIIELPRRVFRNTDAKAHIVILTKHFSPQNNIQIQQLDENGVLTSPLVLSTDRVGDRLDYSYLTLHQHNSACPVTRVRDVVEVLSRGPYSSVDRHHCGHPVFHTTDFGFGRVSVPNQFVLSKAIAKTLPGTVAQAGDILLARVGRNLEEKVCSVTSGFVAVSDCVFVLRVKAEFRKRLLSKLLSAEGKKSLSALSHGVGARFITTESLLNLPIG